MDPPKVGASLLYRGAEADLLLSTLEPWKVIVKRRVRKRYRNAELDAQIRRDRTFREAVALREAKRAGVRSPSVLELDMEKCSITMTFIHGYLARDQLDTLPSITILNLLEELGDQIGRLHHNGWIHGDFTTSNVIFAQSGLPFLLDFGMSSRSLEPEHRGVDLHLLQRSLVTSHMVQARSCMKAVIHGYKKALGRREADMSVRKQAEIARRGRYFAIR